MSYSTLASLWALGLTLAVTGCSNDSITKEPLPTVELPADFPHTAPQVSGRVVEVGPLGETGWSVTRVVSSRKEQEETLRELLDQGFIEHGEGRSEGVHTYSLTSQEQVLSLSFSQHESDWLVTYSFTQAP